MNTSKNKLYTLSYFRKRLHSSGIPSKILVKYSTEDIRYWTIDLFPDTHNIFCTCFKSNDKYWFELWDGGNKLKNKRIISMKSMNVIIEMIYSILIAK